MSFSGRLLSGWAGCSWRGARIEGNFPSIEGRNNNIFFASSYFSVRKNGGQTAVPSCTWMNVLTTFLASCRKRVEKNNHNIGRLVWKSCNCDPWEAGICSGYLSERSQTRFEKKWPGFICWPGEITKLKFNIVCSNSSERKARIQKRPNIFVRVGRSKSRDHTTLHTHILDVAMT